MKRPIGGAGASKSESKTKIGNFYRAHRAEVLAGAGIVVAGVAYWRSKHPSSSSTASTATNADAIDPATGVPYATELSEAQSGITSSAPGVDGSSYGDGGSTGYTSGGGSPGPILSQLDTIQTELAGDQAILGGQMPTVTPSGDNQGMGPTPNSPEVVTVPTAQANKVAGDAHAVTVTQQALAANRALAAKSPSKATTAAIKVEQKRLTALGTA